MPQRLLMRSVISILRSVLGTEKLPNRRVARVVEGLPARLETAPPTNLCRGNPPFKNDPTGPLARFQVTPSRRSERERAGPPESLRRSRCNRGRRLGPDTRREPAHLLPASAQAGSQA